MAATMQNYARSTFLSDIITVPAFTQYVKEAIFERSLFVQSGAVVRNTPWMPVPAASRWKFPPGSL